ncbi:unnamed protein product [Protopolystoma xenopodis]|uniref:Uncharacterized protein n=1 Tax=Protopolystoma xenopodis TaxID=117903 RepID=A0A448WKR1_9PLAT|nr:unnamed protein product [Protopolystoma xenopodis]
MTKTRPHYRNQFTALRNSMNTDAEDAFSAFDRRVLKMHQPGLPYIAVSVRTQLIHLELKMLDWLTLPVPRDMVLLSHQQQQQGSLQQEKQHPQLQQQHQQPKQITTLSSSSSQSLQLGKISTPNDLFHFDEAESACPDSTGPGISSTHESLASGLSLSTSNRIGSGITSACPGSESSPGGLQRSTRCPAPLGSVDQMENDPSCSLDLDGDDTSAVSVKLVNFVKCRQIAELVERYLAFQEMAYAFRVDETIRVSNIL